MLTFDHKRRLSFHELLISNEVLLNSAKKMLKSVDDRKAALGNSMGLDFMRKVMVKLSTMRKE